jgi:isocitrate dehydrogenase (NAD+)
LKIEWGDVEKMGKTYRFSLIRGDGIGPEIMEATLRVIRATGIEIEWEEVMVGEQAQTRFGHPFPEQSLETLKKNRVALKGPLIVPKGSDPVIIEHGEERIVHPSINSALRRELGCFANMRPVKTFPGLPTRYPPIDIVIIREVTEDLYSGLEQWVDVGVAEAVKRTSRKACDQITRFAFDYAKRQGRKRITLGHKANVLSLTDGLFLHTAREIARDDPTIAFDDLMIDALCFQLVNNPVPFDILLLSNQYGDILSDLCAGLVGSLGLAPGANIGEECSVFEASHGAAPDIAGQNIANPLALVLSASLMLKHLGEIDLGVKIEDAVAQLIRAKKGLTQDLGGSSTTWEMALELVRIIEGGTARDMGTSVKY